MSQTDNTNKKTDLDNENRDPKDPTATPNDKKGKSKKKKKNGKKGGDRKSQKQDPFWYAADEQEIREIGTFEWNEVAGGFLNSAKSDIVPAAMVLKYVPTVGNTESVPYAGNRNYLNQSADSYFQAITQGYTGAITDFESPDLFMIAVASADLASLFEEGRRLYNIATKYKKSSVYAPKYYMRAAGFDPDMFTSGEHTLNDFAADFNLRAGQFNEVIAVPANFRLLKRWIYINRFIFLDTDIPNFATRCMYHHAAVLKYSATHLSTGTCLQSKRVDEFATSYWTYDEYFDLIDELLDSLTSQDAQKMYGALRRVYSDSDFYKIPGVLEGKFDECEVRNDIVLAAIHNADFASEIVFSNDFNTDTDTAIYQDASGGIHSNPKVSYIVGANAEYFSFLPQYDQGRVLDGWAINHTPGNTLDMIQHFAPIFDSEGAVAVPGTILYAYPVACRSELLYPPMIVRSFENSKYDCHQIRTMYFNDSVTEKDMTLDAMFALAHINYHPFMRQFTIEKGIGLVNAYVGVDPKYWGEIDNYTLVDDRKIIRNFSKSMYRMCQLPSATKSVTK